ASSSANNTGAGFGALASAAPASNDSTGEDNSAFGAHALTANTVGALNSAFGMNALEDNVIGSSNVAIGASALQSATSSNGNTIIGTGAGVLLSDQFDVSGPSGNNTFIGLNAGAGFLAGSNNVIIGDSKNPGFATIGQNNI